MPDSPNWALNGPSWHGQCPDCGDDIGEGTEEYAQHIIEGCSCFCNEIELIGAEIGEAVSNLCNDVHFHYRKAWRKHNAGEMAGLLELVETI